MENLQAQVRDHIRSDKLFDWGEALTENEMTYLENLLLTFNPLCPPGSFGFEEQKRHIAAQPKQEAIESMPDVEKLCEQYLPNQFELKSFKHKEILFLQTAFEQGARVMYNTIKNSEPESIQGDAAEEID